jgi:hypothetical protein
MVVTLIEPPPVYLGMPVPGLDNVALAETTLGLVAEAAAAIALPRTTRIDATRLDLRLATLVGCNPDRYRLRPDPRTPRVAAEDKHAPRLDAARRPPVEPAPARLIEIARNRPLVPVHLINTVASLAGAPWRWRTTGLSLFPDASGLVVRLPAHEQVQGALRRILRFADDRECILPPLAQAGAKRGGAVGASSCARRQRPAVSCACPGRSGAPRYPRSLPFFRLAPCCARTHVSTPAPCACSPLPRTRTRTFRLSRVRLCAPLTLFSRWPRPRDDAPTWCRLSERRKTCVICPSTRSNR